MNMIIETLGRKLVELAFKYTEGGMDVDEADLHAVAHTITLLDPAGPHVKPLEELVAALANLRHEEREAERLSDDDEPESGNTYHAEVRVRAALKAALAPFRTPEDCPHCGAFERRCATDLPPRGRVCVRTDKDMPEEELAPRLDWKIATIEWSGPAGAMSERRVWKAFDGHTLLEVVWREEDGVYRGPGYVPCASLKAAQRMAEDVAIEKAHRTLVTLK